MFQCIPDVVAGVVLVAEDAAPKLKPDAGALVVVAAVVAPAPTS